MLQLLITKKKKQAFINLQNDQQSATKKSLYQQANAKVQKITQNLKNQWWRENAIEIQQLTDAHDSL